MPAPVSLAFEVKDVKPTVLSITGQDGKKYEMRLALVITGVADQGILNPLDGLPIFQIGSQVVVQVKPEGQG